MYDRRKGVDEQQLTNQTLPTEAALGVLWDVENDMFIFRVNLKEKPGTRRGMLSILSSIFDPLGLVSPFVLKGRKILQQLCEKISNGMNLLMNQQQKVGSIGKLIYKGCVT